MSKGRTGSEEERKDAVSPGVDGWLWLVVIGSGWLLVVVVGSSLLLLVMVGWFGCGRCG